MSNYLKIAHGSADEVVPFERSLVTYDRLLAEGWRVTLREVPTDHAGAIGTAYDPALQRCVPSDGSSCRSALERSVAECDSAPIGSNFDARSSLDR